ncbi:unnamed protein product [Larinioides sclopetarius]|uniref:Uncharacterized protein n=1 Tax=Larinioides sclopetarius TaxID=280406 RepID=A0AAV2AET2_9ARAC
MSCSGSLLYKLVEVLLKEFCQNNNMSTARAYSQEIAEIRGPFPFEDLIAIKECLKHRSNQVEMEASEAGGVDEANKERRRTCR